MVSYSNIQKKISPSHPGRQRRLPAGKLAVMIAAFFALVVSGKYLFIPSSAGSTILIGNASVSPAENDSSNTEIGAADSLSTRIYSDLADAQDTQQSSDPTSSSQTQITQIRAVTQSLSVASSSNPLAIPNPALSPTGVHYSITGVNDDDDDERDDDNSGAQTDNQGRSAANPSGYGDGHNYEDD